MDAELATVLGLEPGYLLKQVAAGAGQLVMEGETSESREFTHRVRVAKATCTPDLSPAMIETEFFD